MPNPPIATWRPRETCRRADLDASRAIRRLCDRFFDGSHCAEALASILGGAVEVAVLSARQGPPSASLDHGIAVDLVGGFSPELAVTVEVEAELAVLATARALKRRPPRVHGPVDEADATSLGGGLAAILATVSRKSPAGPLVARGAGSSATMFPAWASRGRAIDTVALRVSVGGEAYSARLHVAAAPPTASAPPWSRDRLRRMGDTPIEVPVVGWVFSATAGDIASLGVGDAWMLGRASWEKGPSGPVVLAASDAEIGACADLVESGGLVLRPGATELGGKDMPRAGENDPIVEAIGDIPVVVRVEVGTARLSAREWAALDAGDVVALGRGVGDPVTLRVGGVEVATGELVDIEGEMGVRILRRLGGERAP